MNRKDIRGRKNRILGLERTRYSYEKTEKKNRKAGAVG